jgi:hypothetical protein
MDLDQSEDAAMVRQTRLRNLMQVFVPATLERLVAFCRCSRGDTVMRAWLVYGLAAAAPFLVLLTTLRLLAQGQSVCPPYSQSAGNSSCTNGLPPTWTTCAGYSWSLCGGVFGYNQDTSHNWNGNSSPVIPPPRTYVGQTTATTCYTKCQCKQDVKSRTCIDDPNRCTSYSSNPYATLTCP